MANYSPLRYPGGKGKLASYVARLTELNLSNGGHYAEPFAGGGAVALELMFLEYVRCIHINDIDRSIYAFWHSAVHDTENFLRKLNDTPVDLENWRRAKEVYAHADDASLLDLGFATFFMNRTNRSGILNGGLIGGLAQAGVWKMDCRYNKPDLMSRITKIGYFKSRITVCNMDATDFLRSHVSKLGSNVLVYLDPPYYVKGACLYQNHFKHEDHTRLAGQITDRKRMKWIVSYDNEDAIKKLYARHRQEEFNINYSARNYQQGKEVMVFSDNLIIPERIFLSDKEGAQIGVAA